jgi:glycosyltransferase involved in cell wall biosynthesis
MSPRGDSRWVLLAASGRAAADTYAYAHSITPDLVLTKEDLLVSPRRLAAGARAAGVRGALLHSTDWHRQRNPQLYEIALALMPVEERYIVDERRGTVRRVGAVEAAARVARVPADALRAAGAVAAGATALGLKRPRSPARPSIGTAGRRSVLALWPGAGDSFGGSITHITGILEGLRHCGYRVGLVTRFPPPERLRSIVDDLVVVPPLSSARRINADVEQLSSNSSLREAGAQLARRIRPAFVYQRHCPFLTAGADIADRFWIPLVLEWNGSELWVRRNWQKQLAVKRLVDGLLAAMERSILARSAVIAAVSREAAQMAVDAGASWSRTIVLPNAVDIEHIDLSLHGAAPERNGDGTLLGWAGSFGPWHGADVAVRALAGLPGDVHMVMVGDGEERAASQALAESLGVAPRVRWTGAVPRAVALRTLWHCDVLLSPHTPLPDQPFFGSPTKLFEYMALGRPIVASRLNQIGEILEDGVTARLVTPGSVEELVQAIGEVLRSSDRGRVLGEAARRDAASRHSWDHRARTLLARLGDVSPDPAEG